METSFGKYQVKREIGRGAMGSVYLAFDAVLERDVAIKTISSTIREQHLKERFIREARAAGKLCHNNIVTIYDFGVDDERLYIAMEYLEGKDLYQLIAERTPMDIKDKLKIVHQICLGLEYAHRNDVFHRDIKPANVRLLPNGSVKIVDFGLAVMQSSSLTQSGAFLGTPNYVAPERLQGVSGDARSDQFAVGIVMYELLTYSRAFTGETISTVIFSVLNNEPRAMDPQLNGRYPKLAAIIQRAITKDPQQRYDSLQDMAADIQTLIDRMNADGFVKIDTVTITDAPMPAAIEDTPTDQLELTRMSSVIEAPRKRNPLHKWIASGLVLALLGLLYFLIIAPALQPGPKDQPTPVAALADGFLTFDVKPFAQIQKITGLTDGKTIPLADNDEENSTPLRISLKPGKYEIVYTHPAWNGVNRSKIITVAAGETVFQTDQVNQSFLDEAFKHFALPILETDAGENKK